MGRAAQKGLSEGRCPAPNRRDRQRIGMLDGVLDLRGRPIAPPGE